MVRNKNYPYPLNLYRDFCKIIKKSLLESISADEEKGLRYLIDGIQREEDKRLLLSRYKEGITYTEIAKDKGCSKQNIQSKIKRILTRICNTYYIGLIHGYEQYVLTTTIEDLNLSTRSERALLRNNINTLDDLRKLGKDGIHALRFIGETSYDEIITKTWFLWAGE